MMRLKEFDDQLQEWSQQHDLIEEAIASCRVSLKNWEQDDKDIALKARWSLNEIQPHFDKQSLVFKHDIISCPYIDTQIGLYIAAESKGWFRDLKGVGRYRLLTSLDGQVLDDVLVLDNAYEAEWT